MCHLPIAGLGQEGGEVQKPTYSIPHKCFQSQELTTVEGTVTAHRSTALT